MVFNENALYKDEHANSFSSNKQPKKKDQFKLENILDEDIVKHISTSKICESSEKYCKWKKLFKL